MSWWLLMINVQLCIDLYRLYINTDRNYIVSCFQTDLSIQMIMYVSFNYILS